MKAVIENIEIGKNNFTKGIYLGLTALSIMAFFISINETGNSKWICAAGILLFGAGYLMALKSKIRTEQDGFTVYSLFKPTFIYWKDITSLSYESSYHGHGVQFKLRISYGQPTKIVELPAKQFNKKKIQRFFEMLNEQCPLAAKNDHFIKLATGTMSWKDKLKMY